MLPGIVAGSFSIALNAALSSVRPSKTRNGHRERLARVAAALAGVRPEVAAGEQTSCGLPEVTAQDVRAPSMPTSYAVTLVSTGV